jgi:hypothetical protein
MFIRAPLVLLFEVLSRMKVLVRWKGSHRQNW